MYEIRKALPEDLKFINRIYKSAREFMKTSGNPNQWKDSYPEEELLISDIDKGCLYVVTDKDEIHGVFYMNVEDDPTYERIYDGSWLNEEEYAVIHRIASDGKIRGIFHCAAEFAKKHSANVRIDTHRDNLVMQRHIEAEGFKRSGIIYLANGEERIAFHYAPECPDD